MKVEKIVKKQFIILINLFSVLFLSAFKHSDTKDPEITVITFEEFLAANPPNRDKCYSCVTVDGELIDHCLIKGNINRKTRIYHCPNWRDYDKTVIDLNKGERYFYTEGEARQNGWRSPNYPIDSCLIGEPMR